MCQASQTFDVLPVQKRAFQKTEIENQALMSVGTKAQQWHLQEKEQQSEVLRSAIQ